jgi:hypothetical protein
MVNLKKLIIIFALLFMCAWSGVSSGATPLDSLIPKRDLPGGWAIIHGPQTYTKKTLFKHINGQAELFFKYGFQKSVFGIYQDKKDRENQIDLDIYDMGSVLHAFGIFSRFRNEERPAGVGLDSYIDDHSVFFYKGKYFVMLYAAESNPVILKEWAKKISSGIVDPSPPPKEIGYFPKSGLKPGSIQYFTEGLLGHQFLKRGFQGVYLERIEVKAKVEADPNEIHLFLAIFKDSQEATSALKLYKNELSKKGKIQSEIPTQPRPDVLKGEDPYQGKIIVLQKGFYLLGVVGFERETEGEARLREFVENVR